MVVRRWLRGRDDPVRMLERRLVGLITGFAHRHCDAFDDARRPERDGGRSVSDTARCNGRHEDRSDDLPRHVARHGGSR
jgi:hypothetical protein